MKTRSPIPTQILPSVHRCNLTPAEVGREFAQLRRQGAVVKIAGTARHDPELLFSRGMRPKHKIDLFETQFYFSSLFQVPELRFFVAYLVQHKTGPRPSIFPRIIYKDLSLAWRTASHISRHEGDIWIGKGDVTHEIRGDHEYVLSNEATTELPLEMQTAVEGLLKVSSRPQLRRESVLEMVLRKSPPDRVEPYRDFTAPRRKAAAVAANLVYGGKSIATFKRKGDPRSLKIVAGYEPDFESGIIETSRSRSRLYGGLLRRFRILSANKKVQYYFVAGSKHVWLYPPQALTTELSSYGVRTVDVRADDDLTIPGYEYHYYDETKTGPELYSQIPTGFAGKVCPDDDAKCDASPWLDKIPIIQQFRRRVLKKK